MNLLEPFLSAVERRGERLALIEGSGAEASYAALAARSERLAGAWAAAGLGPGDRAMIALPVGIGLYAAIAALWRLGAVAVFPEPALGLRGLNRAVEIAAPKALITTGWLHLLRLLPAFWSTPLKLGLNEGEPRRGVYEAAPDHPGLISFTSGSTGRPKAIARSHAFLAAQNACVADLLRSAEPSRDLVGFPVFVIANLMLGNASILPDWSPRRPELLAPERLAARLRATRAERALLPPVLCAKLAEGGPHPGLRAVFTGGGPVWPDILQAMAERLPGVGTTAVYGSTEAEPIAHLRGAEIGAQDREAMRSGGGLLAGRPVPQIRLRLEEGEILVTGEHVNKGYLGGAEDAGTKLRRAGEIWHRTGDSGRLDDQGRLWLLGRQGAEAAGLKPFAVEAAARFWPGVKAAALLDLEGRAVLALEGEAGQAPLWRREAAKLGALEVRPVARIPVDRRHGSKTDLQALRRLLGATPSARA
ncbi:AMP-binding protein [Neomegalonema sp.]|uniref:AMP-binding protein n=1 Tax=Neomegalonema sp. TaxID=2039713 RepID=UPI002634B04F|nr:AMP-binding protein [Neomegalonema sp.]MDD2867065.1 AMP-binding protein [Neomegalonema sp.]